MSIYIIQASRGGRQLPSFLVDGNTLGILDPAMAARRGLDVIASGEGTYLRESGFGSLEAIVGEVTYHVHAAVADDVLSTTERPTVALRQRLDQLARENAPSHQRERVYAAELEAHSVAYAVAADAPGLRKDCARYLYAESLRLHQEAGLHQDRADTLESAIARPAFSIRQVTA